MFVVSEIINPQQLNEAFEIRKKVFVEEQNVAPEIEYDEFESTSKHYLVLYNEKTIATARWRKTEKGIKLERFAVLEEFRKIGAGKIILSHILNIVKMLPERPIYLHAQIQVIPFYKKAGFVAVGEQFEEAGIQHYKMIYSP